MPVTRVDPAVDRVSLQFSARNHIEKESYKMHDPKKMAGLPVGVQIVGGRLEEEKVLEAMRLVEELLRKDSMEYRLLRKW